MQQKKYWEILLEKQRERGKDGLTIPFIIGSQNYLSYNHHHQNITELIYDNLYLKNCPLYDFERGSVLDFDGTFFNRKNNYDKNTNLFSRATVSGTSNLRFEEVEAKNINLPLTMSRRNESATLSDLNALRSRISFDLVSYTQG